MENISTGLLTVEDFSRNCRVCLKYQSDMIDIFGSEISSQIMALTNTKISCHDRLPKSVCQDCNKQIKQLWRFQCQAKDSENYLRLLLLAEQSLHNDSSKVNLNGTARKEKVEKSFVKKKVEGTTFKDCISNPLHGNVTDKIFLILVKDALDNSQLQSEIHIRDLGQENQSSELLHFCRSLIRKQGVNSSFVNDNHRKFSSDNLEVLDTNTGKHEFFECNFNENIYKVNLAIFQCPMCNDSFEFFDYLSEHLMTAHKSYTLASEFKYICPVCSLNELDRIIFLKHLKDHKKECIKFLKVNRHGEYLPLCEFEKDVFELEHLNEKSAMTCKIFKINMSCYKCFFCKELSESSNDIKNHLKNCAPDIDEESYFEPYIKYTCPACFKSWINDIESFTCHLCSHKKDGIFFIKVNEFGEAIELNEGEVMFTTFEKALSALFMEGEFAFGKKYNNHCKKFKFVKMENFCSCHLCGYEARSLEGLSEHYGEAHAENMPKFKVSCPVCFEKFKLTESIELVKHLNSHKDEGVHFLRVSKNGDFIKDEYEWNNFELFTRLEDFFHGKVKCDELEYITSIYVPQVFMPRLTSSNELSYFCDLCKINFGKKQDVVYHLESHAKQLNKVKLCDYVCEKCGTKCYGKGNYKRHFLTHSVKSEAVHKRPKCSICNKTFSNRAIMIEHKRCHANYEIPDVDRTSSGKICETCGRKFSNNSSLAKHRRLHAIGKESALLKCKICDRDFRRESTLARHVSAHLNPNYFECDECKLPLPSSVSLERHKLGHQTGGSTFDCKVCRVSFLSQDRLTAHQAHTGHYQDRKRFECNVCHEKFFVGKEFSQHIKLHPKYKMSECTLCGKRLSTMQSLMLHLSRHFESNSILCPHCGKLFFEERNYHRHLLTHKGLKPFVCDVNECKKSFYTYFELNRHKKYHNDTRDFECSYCPKSFHEANHLKVHVRTHTGERPYICPHCNKGFVTRTRCKQHINLIHQGIGCDLIQSNISKKVAVFQSLETVT